MATSSEMEQVVGKALLDSSFRAKLLVDPEVAAKSINVQLTELQATRIRDLDSKLLEWWALGFWELRGQAENFFW